MKKVVSSFFWIVITMVMVIAFSTFAFAHEFVTLYSPDGAVVKVTTEAVARYKSMGYVENREEVIITMYSADGRTIEVLKDKVEAHKAVGWYTEPLVLMYAADGRTLYVEESKVEAYKAVGWDEKPFILMYAMDGRQIICKESDIEAYKAVGWYDNKADVTVTMYAADGRTLEVFKDKIEDYKKVGWYVEPVVKMYAADGRTLYVEKSNVDAYTAVGWYTAEKYLYTFGIKEVYNEYLSEKDYYGIITLVEEWLPYYIGTEYESSFYTMRTQAIDKWRAKENCPMAFMEYTIGSNYGTPTAALSFINVSYKKIVAFKVKFDCYNIFGEYEDTYYDIYYCDSAKMETLDSWTYTWELDGTESVHTLKNIRVTEVVYADGTKWYR